MTKEEIDQISKLIDLYINDIKFENLKEIEEILVCGNERFCFFDNIDIFFEHYQSFSKIKNLEKTKLEMILDYFAFNKYIKKQNTNFSKENKHERFHLEDEEYFYTVLETYKNKTN
ncbi:hypothetical protein [Flavobacterium sp.]|jgi:hypothetical protein|uniref:hypothetical protein n=1 Tax=Flavobacterium sp. TaxID=239 RepID=UPI0037BEFBDE